MSVITLDEVKKVAKLSRLKITEEEAQKFSEQLNSILEYASKINELDTDNIQSTSHSIPMKNVLRSDELRQSYPREKMLKNVPLQENGFYKVPKIIE